ncbi:hypothetical protein NDR87_27025 [Nocardia sp. CDC159]|uniref:Type I restriction enzyme S subunit n=1 Tax=Nocardia pulmonis TaxID=2951408 RepID=A0A9X2EA63_9NOCA|nr:MULTISPECIES: hypothetical protein [Nocardia]MCM6777147.1 hypothetical protein [Nocardia pulmonis]MCM6790032.1 hypothetical protein [Nocardia sp. CDC159]
MHKGAKTFKSLMQQGIIEIGDGYRAKLEELGGDGPIFLRAGSLTTQGFSWDGNDRFRDDLAVKVKSKMARRGDVVITTKGNSTGRTGYVDTDAPEFVYSPHLSYWRSLRWDIIRPGYLRYWAKCDEFLNQLRAMAHGTDMAPYLSLADQARLNISIPEINTQLGIESVLGALDDKIALNRRLAHVSHDLSASMFDDFVQNDLEATVMRLGDVAGVNLRKVRPKEGGFLRYIDISSVSVDNIEWPERSRWESAPGRARRGVSPGDTIWSTVRPNRKSRALILDDDPEIVVSTGFAVLTPQKVGPAFLYEASRREEFVRYLESVAEGSAYPAVRADRFLGAPVSVLSPVPMEKFERVAMTLQRRVHVAHSESRTLAQLRDTLMPGLLSGAIRVRDAEKVVEEAI